MPARDRAVPGNDAGRNMAASGSMTLVLVALAGNGCIAVAKFVAAALTGSPAMLAEGIHSIAVTANQALLLLGIQRSRGVPDSTHPFGYGMEVYFWAFVVAILLFSLGSGIAIYEGIDRLQRPLPIANPMVSFAVLAAALVFQAASLWAALGERERSGSGGAPSSALRPPKDPALYTVVLEGIAAIAGLIVALAGISASRFLGWAEGDAIASIAIGLILGGVAALMSLQTKGLLIGEAVPPETIDAIRGMIREELGKNGPAAAIHELRSMRLGPGSALVAASLNFRDDATARAIKLTIGRLEHSIKQRFPAVEHFLVDVQGRNDVASPIQVGQGAGMIEVHPAASLESARLGANAPVPGRGAVEIGVRNALPPKRGKGRKS